MSIIIKCPYCDEEIDFRDYYCEENDDDEFDYECLYCEEEFEIKIDYKPSYSATKMIYKECEICGKQFRYKDKPYTYFDNVKENKNCGMCGFEKFDDIFK